MTMIANQGRAGSFTNLRTVRSNRPLWAVVGAAIDRVVTTLLDWQERAHQRRELLALSDMTLRDIGRSRADAIGEADRPCWRD